MTRILVVDDIREFEGATHAKTAADGIALLQSSEWDEIWLDHDLGNQAMLAVGAENTIWPTVEWLLANKITCDTIRIISFNPAGAHAMGMALRSRYHCSRDPGGFNGGLKPTVTV